MTWAMGEIGKLKSSFPRRRESEPDIRSPYFKSAQAGRVDGILL
jgi:hypothetical protein